MPCIYKSPTMGDAHLRVALVTDRGQADLLVHPVGTRGLAAKPWLWWFTDDKQDADVYIHVCSLGMAELRVCLVDSYGAAGWVDAVRRPGARHLR